MNNEIKEIVSMSADEDIEIKYINEKGAYVYGNIDIYELLDYITNLQEELEELREDNYAYHQLMKIQNKREYRSKFLKEFQEEFGKNVLPDYDEIYKRYDKLKKENKQLEEKDKEIEELNNIIDKQDRDITTLTKDKIKLKNIINKLEKWLEDYIKLFNQPDMLEEQTLEDLKEVLDKLKELKEGK